jgi:DNA sulfur modification protein DndB
MTNRHYLPALRGRFGDWAYYCTLMPMRQIAARIDFAGDLHEKKNLSSLIQRELKGDRAKEIAEYIRSNEDRFFNSLVVAIYGGKPQWHPFDIKPVATDISADDLDETARHSVGYLSLTEEEKVFALDGQHRLAGIKKAIEDNPALGNEELSVIFVAHHSSPEGLRRTRKLFTTLNKQAKPVKKSEIIALDESDVVAIVTRHLVENYAYFNDDQVDVLRKQANLVHGDVEHFTTIINLYDTLDVILLRSWRRLGAAKAAEFKGHRPGDDDVAAFVRCAENFFEQLGGAFPELGQYFTSARDSRSAMLESMRSAERGHVLFRPIGLLMFSKILAALTGKIPFEEGMRLMRSLPTRLNEAPYVNTIWNPIAQTVDNRRMSLCRDVLLYMIGHWRGKTESLLERYAIVLGKSPDEVELPSRVG